MTTANLQHVNEIVNFALHSSNAVLKQAGLVVEQLVRMKERKHYTPAAGHELARAFTTFVIQDYKNNYGEWSCSPADFKEITDRLLDLMLLPAAKKKFAAVHKRKPGKKKRAAKKASKKKKKASKKKR